MTAFPLAPSHGNTNKLLRECHCAVLEGHLQHLDQKHFIHPVAGQDGCDGVLHHVCFHQIVPKVLHQTLLDLSHKGLEECWVAQEKDHPVLSLKATHRTPEPLFCSPWLWCFRVVEAMGSWLSRSGSHLVDND